MIGLEVAMTFHHIITIFINDVSKYLKDSGKRFQWQFN